MELQNIGRYQIKSELGRGGMATVYLAYDPNFERDVAIKVLPAVFLHDPQFRVRFDREAKMIASLEHPAIVPVYDFGEQNGLPYIVMRFMAGGSLADRIQTGPLSIEETAEIISRLAPALDAAHSRKIIHRDLKPGNILFDQYNNAFLSDFGIARLTETTAATITGESIVGTPTYMSPEQVQGDKSLDGRSDIYALGVLIYQMLTGRAPYQADTPAKVMLMHILEPVPQILMEKHDLPKAVQTVVERAMAKNPDDRFSTTLDLAKAFDDSLGEEAESATEDMTLISAPIEEPTKVHIPAESAQPATIRADSMPSVREPIHRPQTTPAKPKRNLAFAATILIVLAMLFIGGYALLARGDGGTSTPIAAVAITSTLEAGSSLAGSATDYTATPEPKPTETLSATELPTSTPMPQSTPTDTPAPTFTPTPQRPVIGGADKIGFLKDNDIWVANLDGTELEQITDDGAEKISLQWDPTGQFIHYISGKCIQRAALGNTGGETIACINYIDSLKSFDISPDGGKVALTVDNQMYIVPYDIDALRQVTSRTDLTAMAVCEDFAPYEKNLITMIRWSTDSNVIAAKLIANLGGGIRGDAVQLFRVDQCIPNPRALDNFPHPRFDMHGYDKNPIIQNFTWDGTVLFALNSSVRNDGFGDLYVYNSELYKAYPNVNPIDGSCCYRDPQWSPDGSYLLFAYQDYAGGSSSVTQLYYIPYGSVGTGTQYTPLPLPEITNPRAKPQPILRAVK